MAKPKPWRKGKFIEAIQAERVEEALGAVRRYFAGEHTERPTWEIVSDRPAKALRVIENWK